MHARSFLAFCLMMAIALAGCADSASNDAPDDTDEVPDDSGDSGGDSGEEPSEPTGVGNSAPGASITASVTSGEVPQDVTFEFDGADADGDALTWTLDANGDGEPETSGAALPGNYTHSYLEAGDYLVTFEVTAGEDTTTRTLALNLTDGPIDDDAEPPVIQSASLTWSPGQGGCGAQYSSWEFGTPAAGITHGEFEVDEDTWGQEFIADLVSEQMGISFTGIDFYDEGGAIVGDGGTIFEPEGTVSGTVPAKAVWVLAYDCFATAGSVEYRTTGSPP